MSLFPHIECVSVGENVILPALIAGIVQFATPGIEAGGSRDALAAGAFMMVRAEAFRALGGFEPIRGEMLDDVALARLLKRNDYRVGFRAAPRLLSVRLFKGNHHAFWGTETVMSEGSIPAILDRGEKVHLPPALIFGGDADEWVPVDTMNRTADGWKKAGGEVEIEFYKGANHGFMTGKPDAPYARPALDRMKAFIRKHTA